MTSLQSRSLHIAWNPPALRDRNGIIRKYLVNIAGKFEDVSLPSLTLESHNTSLLISDLYPYSNYTISVSTFTIGEGPFSADLTVTTLEDGKCVKV